MVSLADSQNTSSPSNSSSRIHWSHGRSMRTVRSNLFTNDRNLDPLAAGSGDDGRPATVSENLTDSVVDLKLWELAAAGIGSSAAVGKAGALSVEASTELLDLSCDFSDFSSFNSDISGELQRLASIPRSEEPQSPLSPSDLDDLEALGLGLGFSSEILDSAPPETVAPLVRACVETLSSATSPAESKRAAAARLRLLAKHRSDFRAAIAAADAIPALIPLLRSSDPAAQENAATALLNLSLDDGNRGPIAGGGAIKPLIYALRTGTNTTKQNAACALLSLAMIEENKTVIGSLGAIPPLVSLLIHGSSRGKKDALTTLYKLCSLRKNKERAVAAGAVGPLVGMVGERGGVGEKAMVVLGSLAGVGEGREAIVEAGGIPALVEAIEDGPGRGKEFAVLALLQLCTDSGRNRALLVFEGAIPPLVALSQSGSARAKHKAETLLGYLREQRQEGGVGGRTGASWERGKSGNRNKARVC